MLGGAVAALIGVGVEMLVYATLVLRFGWGPKAAVPTAVCTTALVSPVGLLLRFVTAGINPGVFPDWIACVPIVIFGAPFGAYISTRMPRSVLLKADRRAGLSTIRLHRESGPAVAGALGRSGGAGGAWRIRPLAACAIAGAAADASGFERLISHGLDSNVGTA